MNLELAAAASAITLALAFYTVGVFSERLSGSLSLKHVALFWMGLACDATGTTIMTNIAQQGNAAAGIHGVSGTLAILLMLFHATWATYSYVRGSEKARASFHTFSTIVWLIWLIPYIIGMLVGIPAIHLAAVCAVGTSVLIVALIAFAVFAGPRIGAARRG